MFRLPRRYPWCWNMRSVHVLSDEIIVLHPDQCIRCVHNRRHVHVYEHAVHIRLPVWGGLKIWPAYRCYMLYLSLSSVMTETTVGSLCLIYLMPLSFYLNLLIRYKYEFVERQVLRVMKNKLKLTLHLLLRLSLSFLTHQHPSFFYFPPMIFLHLTSQSQLEQREEEEGEKRNNLFSF